VSREPAPRGPLVCFGLAALCAAAFAAAYVLDWGTPAFGATMGGAFAFVALGLGLWSRLDEEQTTSYVEEREVGPTPRPDFERFVGTVREQPVPRSGVLWGGLVASLGAIGLAGLFPLRSMFPNMHGNPNDILARSPYRRGMRLVTEEDEFVKPSDLEEGSILTVFPEGYDKLQSMGATLVIRVPTADLDLPPSREQWVVDGVLAYSKLCTHAGCPVGLYAEQAHQLLCPCHHSVFNVLDGAQPMQGPAAHPLPQLPLGTDAEGYLIATGPFSGPVGASWWGFPT
jgi:ubiquinol-cytochrome c reductase iron-sulfur subunit